MTEPPNTDSTGFDPREYLRCYYAGDVADDDRVVLAAASRWAGLTGKRFDRCLEVGCGPTVHHAVPFVPFVREVHLCDFLPANLAEVRTWLGRSADAHDWSAFVREVLASEGGPADADAVERRCEELRRKVTAVVPCDLRLPHPLGEPAAYDLVTSFYTAECAATTKPAWREVMRNLLGLVRPGGSVYMASILNCERYDILGRWFETAAVTADDVVEALAAGGFGRDGIAIESARTADMADHGFTGIYLVSATKGDA